jgi:hypothetical protein
MCKECHRVVCIKRRLRRIEARKRAGANELAAGLSSPQREFILRGYVSHCRGYSQIRKALTARGLIDKAERYTTLGLEVRALLAAGAL